MKLGLVGYGRMGKEIESLAKGQGHDIAVVFDEFNHMSEESDLNGSEVLIDFSTAEVVLPLLRIAATKGVPVVEGTTGWYGSLEELGTISNLTCVYSPNFSTGVYRFMQLVQSAAQLLGHLGYDAYVHEWHHVGKVDSPSGTAKRLAEIMLKELPEKEHALYDSCHRERKSQELHVTSTRTGRVPGIHQVGFDSIADSITLKHVAHGREGFAGGAIKAAEWIVERQGIFTMDDFMNDLS